VGGAKVKILLLGVQGQVGHELVGPLSCFAEVTAPARADLDVGDLDALRRAVRGAKPEVIVNAVACNDVDGAERDPTMAIRINRDAVGVLGEEARQRGAGLVHFSTDFVFDGTKEGPYTEDDAPNPINVYARSKLAGERALLDGGAPALIFRTAWVYSLRRKSFVSTVLRLAREKELLRMAHDQYGSPTFCRDLAQATALILYGMRADVVQSIVRHRGIYHLAGGGSASRYELAKAAVELDPHRSAHRVRSIEPIAAAEFPLPARRPDRTSLDCSRSQKTWGVALPPWREALARALSE
jgi:dTDP-4-dehydrorhamnose reductase